MATIFKSFSVVELVLSLGLAAILLAVSYLAIDPFGRLQKSRDAVRFTDFAALNSAIGKALEEERELTSTFRVPSSSVGTAVLFTVQGEGWVPLNLEGLIGELPKDPLNGKNYTDSLKEKVLAEYQFISDGKFYVLRTHLEYEGNRGSYGSDGADNSWYEVGTAPGLSTYFDL